MFCIIQQNCYITRSLHLILKHTSHHLLLALVFCSSAPLPCCKGQLVMANLVKHSLRLSYQFTFLLLKSHPSPLQCHYTDNCTSVLSRAAVECVLSSCKSTAVMYDFIFQTCSLILGGKNVRWPKLPRVILNILRGFKSDVKASMTHAHGCYMDVMTE